VDAAPSSYGIWFATVLPIMAWYLAYIYWRKGESQQNLLDQQFFLAMYLSLSYEPMMFFVCP